MKKNLTVILVITSLIFISCGDKKKEEAPKKEIQKVERKVETPAVSDNVALGKKLFSSKGCMACHHATTKIVGPAIKDIAAVYESKNANIVKFLKGNSEAIVDTDPTQVAIMKNNIETILKDITGEELNAIAEYMRSVK
ncbi:c-type cytochrome [Urechidicola croceus]|uniref:Cytochrome c domain-containing protein n=1 Tax=Urechidicola croceus TaxID=1850246 RepID=A0A1D8P646_9FLAO|nr:c-type cytochrome [Urechidicola croceus]AOW20012.1 hypothetical protein LPB138_04640 [Urechidicola croceus]